MYMPHYVVMISLYQGPHLLQHRTGMCMFFMCPAALKPTRTLPREPAEHRFILTVACVVWFLVALLAMSMAKLQSTLESCIQKAASTTGAHVQGSPPIQRPMHSLHQGKVTKNPRMSVFCTRFTCAQSTRNRQPLLAVACQVMVTAACVWL
uniref:Uncharacterized protein n=1 Tax=Ulva partita TaxID=1605170 RepID=A0A1C9ZPS0_9CHLO|nr:hypothetical protein [Ulva partita]